MKIGDDWIVDDTGRIECAHCHFKSWAEWHRCWDRHEKPNRFIHIFAPDFVVLIAKNKYDIWRRK